MSTIVLGFLISVLINTIIQCRRQHVLIAIDGTVLNLKLLRGPLRLLLPALAVRAVLPTLILKVDVQETLAYGLDLLIIFAIAWLARRGVLIGRDLVQARSPIDVEDNLEARRVQTQYRVVERISTAMVAILAIGAMLITFEEVRQFGVSLLASAGLVGIVLGFAAQKA